MNVWQFMLENHSEVLELTLEHLWLVGVSTLLAVLIGIPLGVSVGFLKGKGGVPLRYARWRSALKERHGTVCIFPGRSEFIDNSEVASLAPEIREPPADNGLVIFFLRHDHFSCCVLGCCPPSVDVFRVGLDDGC